MMCERPSKRRWASRSAAVALGTTLRELPRAIPQSNLQQDLDDSMRILSR